jgi:hypothetical protein
MDTEQLHCAGSESTVLNLDYKEIRSKDNDYTIWVIIVEAILLVKVDMRLCPVERYRTPTLGSETPVLECPRCLKGDGYLNFRAFCQGRTC